ncbi:hypothetical protein, partial [Desulfococcus sp.]|uniref:hypothetical protein n=1 Tax=Desulfococcus sp. TaxID=2025834 RepID=UPI003592EA58
MKSFESFLARELEAFLAYRKGLGYDLRNIRTSLLVFDRYIKQQPDPTVFWQPLFYLKFREDLQLAPASVNGVLYAVRCFFEYLKRTHGNQCNPLQDLPCLPQQAFIPFV